jgi:hypothetical protein
MKRKDLLVTMASGMVIAVGLVAVYGQQPNVVPPAPRAPATSANWPASPAAQSSPFPRPARAGVVAVPYVARWFGAAHSPELEELENESRSLANELRSLNESESDRRESTRKNLLDVLDKAFELRQQIHAKRAAELKERLAKVEESIEQRNQNKKLIIENRVSELLGEGGVLAWDVPMPTPTPVSAPTVEKRIQWSDFVTQKPPAGVQNGIILELNAAQENLVRMQELKAKQVIPDTQLHEAERAVLEAKAKLKSARDSLQLRERSLSQQEVTLKRRLETAVKRIDILSDKHKKNPDDDGVRLEILEAEEAVADLEGQLRQLGIERDELARQKSELEDQGLDKPASR